MSHWKESTEIVAALHAMTASGERASLATVVSIEGSAYRRPGAKLLVGESGTTLGGVSGGCLEADVREVARGVLASGEPMLRTYDSRRHEDIVWGLGLGCNGRVDVFVQPAIPGAWSPILGELDGRLAGDAPFSLATRLDDGSVTLHVDRVAEEPNSFVERFLPPTPVIVCGADDDAVPLVERAAEIGFRVTVVDHRPALLTAVRFPNAFALRLARPDGPDGTPWVPPHALAVVKMHSFVHDRDWAKRLLVAGLPFVGLLGPRDRQARIRREIGADDDARLVGPVGLDLGGEGAQQIAISIVAQLLALDTGRAAKPLAESERAIHAG